MPAPVSGRVEDASVRFRMWDFSAKKVGFAVTLNSYFCDLAERNPCDPNPCEKGGKCLIDKKFKQNVRCKCTHGIMGFTCSRDLRRELRSMGVAKKGV